MRDRPARHFTLMFRPLVALAISMALLSPNTAMARSAETPVQLTEFFAGQGCAIGPATLRTAVDAGFESGAIEAFAETLENTGDAIRQGEWLLLSPEACAIRIPEITSELQLTDPDVAALISAPDEYVAEGSPGCFLAGAELFGSIQKTRGWDADKANMEYVRLLASNLLSGDLTFYSDDPLRTPMGFAVTTGECADVPSMPEIEMNHALLVDHFDALVRASGETMTCKDGASTPIDALKEVAGELSDGEATNAWVGFEVMIVALGADWYEGMSGTNRGTPRPPLCHYE